jgi:hypothetical protein
VEPDELKDISSIVHLETSTTSSRDLRTDHIAYYENLPAPYTMESKGSETTEDDEEGSGGLGLSNRINKNFRNTEQI